MLKNGVFTAPEAVGQFDGTDIATPISGVELVAGQEYRLELYCETCAPGASYRIFGRSTSEISSPLAENTFQGVDSYGETSLNGGASWTANLAADLKFLFVGIDNIVFADGFE